MFGVLFFFSSRRRHTCCALVTGVQTCALPIYDPIDRAVEEYVRLANRESHRPGGGHLPLTGSAAGGAVGLAIVEVQCETVEAGQVQIETRSQEVVLIRYAFGRAFTTLIGGGNQNVLDHTERQVASADIA